ncbi:hypothetical protein GGR51DRAFT_578207 [Nemania sp. FL0031]|nr:hypothetical protein GGR51DRAFT_578207 [Nemania sp. FL0031]
MNSLSMQPLTSLNEHRSRLGLPPSRNLISSPAYNMENRSRNSPAYQGNLALRRNVPAEITDEENCRLRITGLPRDCTVHQLLGSIRDIGPVFASHIIHPSSSPPLQLDSATDLSIWETAAASLTFWSAPAANEFLRRHDARPFTVENHQTRVIRHRIRTESVDVNGQSRVLRIVGDPSVVNPDHLERVFSYDWQIVYDTDYVQFNRNFGGGYSNEVIWAFGSFRAQAHTVHKNINRCFAGRAQAVYMADPCAMP